MTQKPDERRLRAEVVKVAHALHRMGWVANHDGNVTARLASDRFLATPTAVSKADVDESKLIVVDAQGKVVAGSFKPFSELVLHLAAYQARPDVNAVVHAHPPVATGFAVAGRGLDRPIIAEAVVSLGAKVPLAPFAMPGTPAYTQEPRDLLAQYDAILLESHGALTIGVDLEQAYLRMELVEHLAKIEWHAQALGGARYLSAEHVQALLEKRRQAGLGPRARPAPTAAAPAPAAPTSVATKDADLLRRVVAEELKKVLSRRD